jgi:CAAX prenyl protease-like protein
MAVKNAPQKAPQRSQCARLAREYWLQSRRPLASLAFVLPLLIVYEGGVLLLGTQAVRNGADVWLRRLLDVFGFGQYFLLPALTIGLLLAWHHMTRDRWQISAGVVYAMFAECAVLGLLLLGAGRLQGFLAQTLAMPHGALEARAATIWLAGASAPMVGRVLGFAGAGVYEEMLFRMLLLPPISECAKRLGARRGLRIAGAVIVTSLLFSAAHYWGPHGETFDAFSFWFRFTAGAFFAVLFVFRGFGIAAGTHALYDIFVSLG